MDNLDKKNSDRKIYIIIGLILFFLTCIILLASVYLYLNNNHKTTLPVPTDTAMIMLKVGRLVDLPSGETPQVAPINDIAPFKNQPFFTRARMGDILIVYINSHLAILYSPDEDKIINMSKVTVVVPKPAAL